MKKLFSYILALVVMASCFPVTALAAGTMRIADAEDFLAFCQNCRTDTYSQGRKFILKADIDLAGEEICVPSFSGSFDGGGHTISGVCLTSDGSRQGLFRTVTEEAEISDLTVEGVVTPGGTGVYVGGIAGENYGTIIGCAFHGEVRGVESVGGIAGYNCDTGVIAGCSFEGQIQAETKVGGIAGENAGLILSCRNAGGVNIEAVEETTRQIFDISSILNADLDAILAVSDIGGITGFSSGTVEKCVNEGAVGYSGIGYNVGGIAGRSSGFVSEASNSGEIYGRRDVGGVVGQLEPYVVWDVSESKLDELDDRLSLLDDAVNGLTQSAGAQMSQVTAALNDMMYYASSATSAIGTIITRTTEVSVDLIGDIEGSLEDYIGTDNEDISAEDREAYTEPEDDTESEDYTEQEDFAEPEDGTEPEDDTDAYSPEEERPPVELPDIELPEIALPDESSREELLSQLDDALQRAEDELPDTTALVDALSGVYSAAVYMGSSVDSVSSAIAGGVENISARVADVFDAFLSATGEVLDTDFENERDISVEQSYELDVAAISGCESIGPVQADENIGGIVGAVGFEVSFDLEDELDLSEILFSYAERQIFAVIRACENHTQITGRKDRAGGITGSLDCGAVLDCLNTGAVTSDSGDYAGGIAGYAGGSLVSDLAQNVVRGGKFVGGIAGLGTNIADCRACAYIAAGSEYLGCIAGWAEGDAVNNLYVETGAGGIDGVDLSGCAEAVAFDELLAMDGTPEAFRRCTVTFLVEDEVFQVLEVPFGGALTELPEVPQRGEDYWKWEEFDSGHIYGSLSVSGEYREPIRTLSTEEDPPLFLVEGTFYEGQSLAARPAGMYPSSAAGDEDTREWTLTVNDYDGSLIVRLRKASDASLFLIKNGRPVLTEYERDGSYIVFPMENGGTFMLLKTDEKKPPFTYPFAAAAAAGLALAGLLVAVRKKRRRLVGWRL